jgi:hypothetical protein
VIHLVNAIGFRELVPQVQLVPQVLPELLEPQEVQDHKAVQDLVALLALLEYLDPPAYKAQQDPTVLPVWAPRVLPACKVPQVLEQQEVQDHKAVQVQQVLPELLVPLEAQGLRVLLDLVQPVLLGYEATNILQQLLTH